MHRELHVRNFVIFAVYLKRYLYTVYRVTQQTKKKVRKEDKQKRFFWFWQHDLNYHFNPENPVIYVRYVNLNACVWVRVCRLNISPCVLSFEIRNGWKTKAIVSITTTTADASATHNECCFSE